MDLKAFDKLYTETVEAIAERRLTDAISLTEAISRDNSDADLCHEDFTKLRERLYIAGDISGSSGE